MADSNWRDRVRNTFTEKKQQLGDWAQESRAKGGVAGAAGVAAGAVMAYDGFARLRKGLGFDTDKDGKALEGGIGTALAGATELLAGAGVAVAGGYAGVKAFRGTGGGPSL